MNMESKQNGELFSGCEQIHKAREALEADWNGAEIRIPADLIEKKMQLVKTIKEDLHAIEDLLVLFDKIKLDK